MKLLRPMLSAISILFLLAGYLMSQYSWINGWPSQWAAEMDKPQIRLLATLLFCFALILSFIPDEPQGELAKEKHIA